VVNFNEHLGDDRSRFRRTSLAFIDRCLRYFGAYMLFFVQHVKDQGIGPTIEKFVFARKANLGPQLSPNEAEENQPQMLNRFFAGVLHPVIHTGYSAEFSLPGMLVEGISHILEPPCKFIYLTGRFSPGSRTPLSSRTLGASAAFRKSPP
jgi:hypothetical protein